jgi:serine/threonine protein kinase
VRCGGGVKLSDIENEARNVSHLLESGKHKNIVTILNHGWISSFSVYFIDMELCDATLRDYIDYHDHKLSAIFPIRDDMAPVCVTNNCSSERRMLNIWTIATHIASGLEFMHSHMQVHRDLKPANGISIVSSLNM